ncbi:MAG: hypothetical protein LBU45_08700, partial [Azoarcus sp.]|nr:hypothetical protein [Azoarcus sp.]
MTPETFIARWKDSDLKKPGRDPNAALKQLTDYALHLDNPPLLVVCERNGRNIHSVGGSGLQRLRLTARAA